MNKKETLLYIDDNPKARRLLTTILKQRGFAVIEAGDSLEEVRKCRCDFDLVLLDYQLPSTPASEIAQQIKSKHPEVPVVMISDCECVPEEDLTFVDAHFGSGTALDDLVATMHMLVSEPFMAQRKLAVARHWADST